MTKDLSTFEKSELTRILDDLSLRGCINVLDIFVKRETEEMLSNTVDEPGETESEHIRYIRTYISERSKTSKRKSKQPTSKELQATYVLNNLAGTMTQCKIPVKKQGPLLVYAMPTTGKTKLTENSDLKILDVDTLETARMKKLRQATYDVLTEQGVDMHQHCSSYDTWVSAMCIEIKKHLQFFEYDIILTNINSDKLLKLFNTDRFDLSFSMDDVEAMATRFNSRRKQCDKVTLGTELFESWIEEAQLNPVKSYLSMWLDRTEYLQDYYVLIKKYKELRSLKK